MKIQIDGVNSVNKGAELMLIAVLEEIYLRYPDAEVLINADNYLSLKKISVSKNVKRRWGLEVGKLLNAVLSRLKIRDAINYFPILTDNYITGDVNLVLDASGFKYSDQWNRKSDWLKEKEKYYSKLKSRGIRVVFLTQAFGPFNTENGKRSAKMLLDNCELIFAREKISYNYLLNEGINSNKIHQSCDFTFKVKGNLPAGYEHLKDAIGIIPNFKMITHGGNNKNNYLNLLLKSISFFRECGYVVFLLNHEGKQDFQLCNLINNSLEDKCEILNNLGAKEVKGVIGNSKLIISSRFHGVASALSQGVPCLATSWNHKYEMLFEDFNQYNNLLNANDDWEFNFTKIKSILDNYEDTVKVLEERKLFLLNQIETMWDKIFIEA